MNESVECLQEAAGKPPPASTRSAQTAQSQRLTGDPQHGRSARLALPGAVCHSTHDVDHQVLVARRKIARARKTKAALEEAFRDAPSVTVASGMDRLQVHRFPE